MPRVYRCMQSRISARSANSRTFAFDLASFTMRSIAVSPIAVARPSRRADDLVDGDRARVGSCVPARRRATGSRQPWT